MTKSSKFYMNLEKEKSFPKFRMILYLIADTLCAAWNSKRHVPLIP